MTGIVGPRRSVHLLSAPFAAERPLCPHELYLPNFFQPSAFMGNRTDFCIDLFAFTIRSPLWETAAISVSICSPSQFAHLHGKPHRFLYRSVSLHNSLTCMGNRTDFCIDLFAFTIRSPASETAPISVRVITTSVSLTAERPFRLQGTHVIPIPFWSHSQSSTSVAKTVRLHGTNTDYRTWERSLAFFLYLPPSIGLLLTVRSRFFFAAERRRTRAFFERHHARAASEFTGWRSSLPFFSMLFDRAWFVPFHHYTKDPT